MGLTYNKASLQRIDYTSGGTRSAEFNLLTAPSVTVAIGEVMQLQVEIQTSNVFANGQTFWVNWAAFRPQQRSNYGVFGTGYRVDISDVGGGVLAASATLSASGNEILSQNYTFNGFTFSAGNERLLLTFTIFITNDVRDWIGSFANDNTARWLLPLNGNNLLTQNVGTSAYRYTSPFFFELWAYEATGTGTTGTPSSMFADPFVRNPAAPTLKSISVPIAGKWYDRGENNAQSWTPTNLLTRNGLDSLTVRLDSTTGQLIGNIKRLSNPTLSDIVDANFEPASSTFPRSLAYNAANYLQASFLLGTLDGLPIDRVSARIINVGNIDNSTDFYTAHQASENDIPATNATPSPNWLNNGFFGTPTSTSSTATTHTIRFLIDGNKLQFKGRYRLIFILYNTAGDFVSTHISPELVADLEAPASIGTPITIFRGLENQFLNSNTSASFWERMELELQLDKTAYTGGGGGVGAFNSQIQMVELVESQGGNVLNTWAYSFQAGAANNNSLLYDLSAGNNLIVAFGQLNNFRAGQSLPLLTSLTTFTYTWRVTFDQPTALGTQSVTYEIVNIVRVRPLDSVRIPQIRFLDAADFDASIITPLERICSQDTEVVVEVQKNAAPDAQLAAFGTQGLALQAGRPFVPTFEFEVFTPTYLQPLQQSPIIGAEASFGDNFAYYRIDLTALRSNNNIFSFGAIIYEL